MGLLKLVRSFLGDRDRGGNAPDPRNQVSAQRPPPVFPLESYGKAVDGRPHYFLIYDESSHEELLGPDSVLGQGRDFTDRERLLALRYLVLDQCATLNLPGPVCEYDRQPLSLKLDTQLPSTDIHHLVRLPNGKRLHQLKFMKLVCHDHNAVYGKPPVVAASQGGEKENQARVGSASALPQASSLETAKHDPQRAEWNRLIDEGKVWTKLKEHGCMTCEVRGRIFFLAKDLREIAVVMTVDPIYGKYSSETFGRYMEEDRFDTLEMLKDGGRWWVSPRDRKRDGREQHDA